MEGHFIVARSLETGKCCSEWRLAHSLQKSAVASHAKDGNNAQSIQLAATLSGKYLKEARS